MSNRDTLANEKRRLTNMRVLVITTIVLLVVGAVFVLVNSRSDWFAAKFYLNTQESDLRLSWLKKDKIIEALKLKPGQKIADIGAGTGLFSWPIARKVAPGGVVFAVDINPILLKEIERKAKEKGINNIRVVTATETDPRIPEKVDLIFCCSIIHYIDDQIVYFEKLRDYLKPYGRVAIIDISKNHMLSYRVKYSPAQQENWLRTAGFELVDDYDFMDKFYFSVYRQSR